MVPGGSVLQTLRFRTTKPAGNVVLSLSASPLSTSSQRKTGLTSPPVDRRSKLGTRSPDSGTGGSASQLVKKWIELFKWGSVHRLKGDLRGYIGKLTRAKGSLIAKNVNLFTSHILYLFWTYSTLNMYCGDKLQTYYKKNNDTSKWVDVRKNI